MAKKSTETSPLAEHLKSWKGLIEYFKNATENQLWELLKYELKHRKRPSVSLRIYGRADEMRYERERKKVLTELGK